ncbi:MAG: carboxypeptidase regulatory-like domain-containing protein [Planctomycetes bacterium]|nr:carboxypeptidase regulatory-like domain-containing protein [Planctomycetota bacterium]
MSEPLQAERAPALRRALLAIACVEALLLLLGGGVLLSRWGGERGRSRELLPPPSEPALEAESLPAGREAGARSANERGAAAPVVASAPSPTPRATEGLLLGRFVDEAGQALANVRGALYASDRSPDSHRELAADARGRFVCAGLALGSYELGAEVSGCLPLRETIEIVEASAPLRRDFVLRRALVLGVRVRTPSGEPLLTALMPRWQQMRVMPHSLVTVEATRWEPRFAYLTTSTGGARFSVGRWSLGAAAPESGLPNDILGSFALDREEALWVSVFVRSSLVAKQAVPSGQRLIDLVVDPAAIDAQLARLRVRLLDGASGAPLADVRVGLHDSSGDTAPVRTDAEGRVAFASVVPGLWQLHAFLPDEAPRTIWIELTPGLDLDLGDLRLHASRRVKGRVEAGTRDVRELRIEALCSDPVPHPALRFSSASAGVTADGRFELRLPPGRFLVRATGSGGASADLDVRETTSDVLLLTLRDESRIEVSVGNLSEPTRCALYDLEQRLLRRHWLRDGQQVHWPCLPGSYEVVLDTPSGSREVRRIEVSASPFELRVP